MKVWVCELVRVCAFVCVCVCVCKSGICKELYELRTQHACLLAPVFPQEAPHFWSWQRHCKAVALVYLRYGTQYIPRAQTDQFLGACFTFSQVDKAIDACAELQNLRTAIFECLQTSENPPPKPEKKSM